MNTHLFSTEEHLRAIVAGEARVRPRSFALDDDLHSTLGVDSLALLKIVADVEREFGIRVPDERLGEIRTLRSALDLIHALSRR